MIVAAFAFMKSTIESGESITIGARKIMFQTEYAVTSETECIFTVRRLFSLSIQRTHGDNMETKCKNNFHSNIKLFSHATTSA
jgi:hypothetical protein